MCDERGMTKLQKTVNTIAGAESLLGWRSYGPLKTVKVTPAEMLMIYILYKSVLVYLKEKHGGAALLSPGGCRNCWVMSWLR